jgi:ketosteroid isomerase-like protein
VELGKPDPGEKFKALGPIYTHVSRDPDADWQRIAPHAKHVVESYADWTSEAYGKAAGPFAGGINVDDLRASGAYQVVTPEDAVAMIQGLGRDRTFILCPLLGGLDPELAWQGLKLFETEVWPQVKELQREIDMSADLETNVERNKQVVRDFYSAMNSRDIDRILEFYAPHTVIEVFSSGPFAGKQAPSSEALKMFFDAFPRIEFSIESMISENNIVTAQVTSEGALADGSAYKNRYHNLYQVEGSKIMLFNEYPVFFPQQNLETGI